jgi:hypothetical protein
MTVSRLSISGTDGILLPGNFDLSLYQDRVVNFATAISGPASQTISSTTPVTITGLSVNYTPAGANTTIFIFANISHTLSNVVSFGIFKDGVATVSTAGASNLNEPNMQATYYLGNNAGLIVNSHLMHYETAGSTVPRTYDIRATAAYNGTITALYINNRSTPDMACFSHMVIMEID